jgi:autotransporter-associated beta strand protein
VIQGTTYYYFVAAGNDCNQSAFSQYVAATPAAPVPVYSTSYWTNTMTPGIQSWNVNANWTNTATFPNAPGSAAMIAANITMDQAIALSQNISLGSLLLGDPDGSSRYIITGNGGVLVFNGGANDATLTQVASSRGDILAVPITIAGNLDVVNSSTNPLELTDDVSGTSARLNLNGGSLQIGNGADSGSLGAVNQTDNGALIFDRNGDATASGTISGSGSVMQTGTGVLTLGGANTFTGGVTIQHGTLLAGSATALGDTSGVTVITNGGTLDLNAQSLAGETVVVSGSGVGSNGCSLNTGGHPYKLTKTGGNQISIVAADVDPALGDIDIQQGLMGWETVTSSMGNPASNIIVRAGATLSFYNASTAWNKHFILYGNGIDTNLYNWSGANVVIGPVQLNGNCVFWGGGTSLLLSNAVSGPGALIKNGPYNLELAEANTYTGETIVNGGNLSLTGNGSITGSSVVNIGAGATLDASGRSDGTLTVAEGQTLAGGGTVNGNAVIESGATFAPGNSMGVMTFNNDLTLEGGSRTVMEINKSATPSNDVAQVSGKITYGGTLVISNIGAMPLAAGDSFKLFNAAVYSGAFTNITPAIPGINLAWNTTGLAGGILSVVPSPTSSPKFGAMKFSGGKLIFSGSNGVPDWMYILLASTNLGLPLTNWSVISTSYFDGSGGFTMTNPAGTNNAPQSFYLLKLQ